ncbi:methionyl-tRNA formyltransferase [Thioalkalivibrio sp. HK1]|uniref:methionyl-tRNA formyltransferase n=1 Tax=Thioalkalivibrio sp. HK1 TaxID=1469245 RepID=UPI00046F6AEF|nr:methionyl-tRNA formyltransferase [Thioalkalivibrio sp. HK1]
MRIIVNGQQDFGKSVLQSLLQRGEEIVGVYCAPDKEGRRPDPLKTFAQEKGLPLFQPRSYRGQEVVERMASLAPDLCVMAYVTLFVPEKVLGVPRHGTIQYHPSLLPSHRGPSSINWPIIWGEKKTGLTIFWPDEGLDEGPILLQKEVNIEDDHTLGTLYFNHLYPLGVEAMLEAVDLVRDGKAPRIEQDHSLATYEGWCRPDLVKINWHLPTPSVFNLIRGSNPQPGAWTTFKGEKVNIFDAEAILSPRSVQPGQILAKDESSLCVATADGQIRIRRLQIEGQKKVDAGAWALESGIELGNRFGT